MNRNSIYEKETVKEGFYTTKVINDESYNDNPTTLYSVISVYGKSSWQLQNKPTESVLEKVGLKTIENLVKENKVLKREDEELKKEIESYTIKYLANKESENKLEYSRIKRASELFYTIHKNCKINVWRKCKIPYSCYFGDLFQDNRKLIDSLLNE
ncbi:hypothetical protein C1646_757045 [Rhizophagus diaphanus]|nr:hypothetical protein C1646_757045 [Rhizophagus diaphanus] [Rhizophagus sp. MUCL 43196]